MADQIIDIEELHQDNHNFNKGTEAGQQLMERSFKELGAGRSVLIDKHGNIIAGNKSQQAAIAAGIKKVRIIETTGDELVAVKRTDIDIDSREGRELALADNATQKVNLIFDHAELSKAQLEWGVDPNQWGVPFLPYDEDDDKKEYQVVITAEDECEQEAIYNKMVGLGYECKILGM